MFIDLEEVLPREQFKDVLDKSLSYFEDGGIETYDPELKDADIIVLVRSGRTLFRAVPGYFTNSDETFMVLNDLHRSFIQNVKNIISVYKDDIHEIYGYKFTMVAINPTVSRNISGHKYYNKACWLRS